jgi:hypothetical protein
MQPPALRDNHSFFGGISSVRLGWLVCRKRKEGWPEEGCSRSIKRYETGRPPSVGFHATVSVSLDLALVLIGASADGHGCPVSDLLPN